MRSARKQAAKTPVPIASSRKDPALLKARINQELSPLFIQKGIAVEVESRLLQSWQSAPEQDSGVEEFLQHYLPKTIEEYFAELRQHCLAYTRSLLRNSERAEDLVQEALLRLIREESQLRHIQAWLRKVIYNLVVEQYRQDKAQNEFLRQLQAETDELNKLARLQELIPDGEIGVLLPDLLAHPDFLPLQRMARQPNLRAYAQSKGITYEQAKQRSKQHKRNLRAACLRKLGWVNTPGILDYQDYKTVQRYVRELVRAGQQAARGQVPQGRFQQFQPELENCFQGFEKLHNWDIRDLGASRYKLYVVGITSANIPHLLNIVLRFPESRRIATEKIGRNEMLGRLELPPGFRVPMDKGKCLLTRQQMEDLIRPIAKT